MSFSTAATAPPELIIEAGRTERQYWRDLFRYRELFLFLAWRDVLVRYKQTAIGVIWALLRPVLSMVALVVVFVKVAGMPTDGVPAPVFIFAATLPWQLFASSLAEGSNSLISNANLISKVYFPRLIVPASAVIVSFVDFLLSLALLGILMVFYRVWPGWHLLAVPFFTFLALVASTGAGLWLAALNVQYRDFRYVVPFIVQFGFFVTPIGYPLSKVPEAWRLAYSLNPMVCVIDGFRWAVSGGHAPFYLPGLWVGLAVMCALLTSGVWYFRRMERTFADVI